MENSDVKIINPKTLILTDTDFYLTGQGIFLKIRYDPDEDDAPVISYKGSGYSVEQLRLQAAREQIAIIEDAALTRSLFELLELGDEVPSEIYPQIVEIMDVLYQRKNSEYLRWIN